MIRRKNDILLKAAFEECFTDLLLFFIPTANALFDLAKGFQFMDKELLEITPDTGRTGGSRYSDLLVKTWLKNGSEEWILIHIEIQGQNDKTFARRMFSYYYRILDRYNVPTTAFAIFTGSKKQEQPSLYERKFLGTELLYRYNTYQIFNHSEQQLLQMNNRFALVVLAAQKVMLSGKIPEAELSGQRLTIAKAFIESGRYSHEQIRKFISFLKQFVHVENKEINSIFDKQINSLTGNKDFMDIIDAVKLVERLEGIEEGEKKGKRETTEKFVVNLILQLGLADEQAAKIANTNIKFVQQIRRKLNSTK